MRSPISLYIRNIQINLEQRKKLSIRSYSSNSFLEIRTPLRRSNVQSNFQSRLEEVDFSSTILDLNYKTQEENLSNMSPTHSQMMSLDEPYLAHDNDRDI